MIQQEGVETTGMKSAIKSLPSRYGPSAIPAEPKERLTGDSEGCQGNKTNLPQKRKNPDAAKVKEKKCGSALDKAQGESYEKTERKTAHSLCANSSSIAEAILTTAEYAGDSVKDPTTGDSMPSSQLHVKAKKKLLGLPYPYGRTIHDNPTTKSKMPSPFSIQY